MRTAINATWVVGHENGRHTLIHDGSVVYENNRIVHVGRRFDGQVDRTIEAKDRLVAPGFIDTHVHAGHRASHRLISDTGRPMYYGQPFLEISVPKEGKKVVGDVRYFKHGEAGADAALALNSVFTVAELLRNGVTTFVEFGSQLSVQDGLLQEVTRLGTRAYLAPGYDCGRWVGDEKGRLKRVRNDAQGIADLERAVGWIEQHDGAAGGRIKGILVPREVETSSLELLQRTVEVADRTGQDFIQSAQHLQEQATKYSQEAEDLLKDARTKKNELEAASEGVQRLGRDFTSRPTRPHRRERAIRRHKLYLSSRQRVTNC
jgi:cytosine/adenosine deaminase-related metal-dependent hydrolase